jgi:hypothetical protein
VNWKKVFGLDAINTAIFATVSVAIGLLIAVETGDPEPVIWFGCTALVTFGVTRSILLHLRAREERTESSGAWRLAEAEAHLAELEELRQRVAELEERADFSERLLAGKDEPLRLARERR